jgi:hypothetical protein
MPLRPAEVHAKQHLGPVGRLGPAGASTDRQQGAALVVLAGEEELRSFPVEIPFEAGGLTVELPGQLGVTRFLDELERREEVLRARAEASPQLDLRSEAVCLAENALRDALVIPEARRAGLCVELGDALLLGV